MGNVCVAGTCTPLVHENSCSPEIPDGLCPAGSACLDGQCRAITSDSGCSSRHPDGLCPGGAQCEDGLCVGHPCEEGWACELDNWCNGEVCLPLPCDPIHPGGVCDNSLLVCIVGVCVESPCSPENPTGPCPTGFECRDGSCQDPLCSLQHPNGVCLTVGDVCFQGECIEGPCAANNLDGVCSGQATTYHPSDGSIAVDTVCCDASLNGITSCELGTCSAPACSTSEPHGACEQPLSEFCNVDNCADAPCGRWFPQGYCSGGEQCWLGVCAKRGCRGEPDPNAFCAPMTCDLVNNICVNPPCSVDAPTGRCPIGKVCMAGVCETPECSSTFPGGICANPEQLCAGGTCIDPPCSSNYPNGACGPNFECNGGICGLSDCGVGAPLGYCPTGERCVASGCEVFGCSAIFPTGPCPVGMLCVSEACETPACSVQYPGGACAADEVCAGGHCVPQPCSTLYPSGICGTGFTCVSGTCTPAPCSGTVPNGTCPGSQVCLGGACVDYECGINFPNGPCPIGQKCLSPPTPPTCQVPACSSEFPGGICPSPQICSRGTCVTPACSAAVTNGACPAGQVCCDSSLSSRPCTVGTCVLPDCVDLPDIGYCPSGFRCVGTHCIIYQCGSTFTHGPCPTPGQICISETCQNPPCSPQYPAGVCDSASPPEICSGGSCVPMACSPAVDNGACPSNQVCCDVALQSTRTCVYGTCVVGACSPSIQTGWCPAGEICCDSTLMGSGFCPTAGQCVPVSCSPSFPFGSCPGDQVCVAGACEDPCGPTEPLGWCPTGFACVEARCSLACTADQDCDGISDIHEDLATLVNSDTDMYPDAYDRDSDGDVIPDAVEGRDLDGTGFPHDYGNNGSYDFRERDSDGDHISDTLEAGPAPGVPVDTDFDDAPDYIDQDSDGDGILDACEVNDDGAGLCGATGVVDDGTVLDSDVDGVYDFRDLDADGDGVSDRIEARATPASDSTFNANGIDHDSDGTPDYRDADSDGDGVADIDEDVNGDGIVNCQVDGTGVAVPDTRSSPDCLDAGYDYNPGCIASSQKCLLAETSRVHADTDGDDINDGVDGIFYVCSAANLKPINVFYSQPPDYALALEQSFDATSTLFLGGIAAGMTFDDVTSANGSAAVSGFVLQRTPHVNAINAVDADPDRVLITKALAQELEDSNAMDAAVDAVATVINRNFVSFDGYGVVISRYDVHVNTAANTGALRNTLVNALAGSAIAGGSTGGPSANDFTLLTETLYRYGDPTDGPGSVLVVGALVRTGSTDTTQSFNYRTRCSAQATSGACGSRLGCTWNATVCEEASNYQIPLFFSDNITNGSAITQYGDDLAALCQTMVQQNGVLDFLWIVDDSGSMAEEIAQVQTSAELFFGIMNNTEADYRVAQTTTYEDRSDWEPSYNFASTGDEADRRNGVLQGGFTGAIAGVIDTSSTDRTVAYNCADGCDNGASDCCSLCGSGTVNDPACYFASRLPTASSRGQEFGLLIGEWALYRSNAPSLCAGVTDASVCVDLVRCDWNGGVCMATNCDLPECSGLTPQATCEAVAGCDWVGGLCQIGVETTGSQRSAADECNGHDTSGSTQVPYGGDNTEDELELPGCEWNPVAAACWPSIGYQCTRYATESACDGQAPRCDWQQVTSSTWACVPNPAKNTVLCTANDETTCVAQVGCAWDAAGFCRPPLTRAFRADASKVAVVLSDEEECYLKDDDFNGTCDFGTGAFLAYDHPIRLAREQSYLRFYQSRGFMVFSIVGNKANRSLLPGQSGGCATAEPGDSYIMVAEGTGGGWGSICAADLYPTIEAIVIGSLGRSSPYRLEGFIDGSAVQPIASTIKVAVEVCKEASEYPICGSGTEMKVVPRSRESGFDYDTINNTLILYGTARPVLGGDIVASYRYWVDRVQPPEGNPSCPCPETSPAACDCPPGHACGQEGVTNHCGAATNQTTCEATPGCAWNTANGGVCMVTGLCESDPTCGGDCGPGMICDPILGLCVCDVTCGGECTAGETCDNNRACNAVEQSVCDLTGTCSYDTARSACYSATCGECDCDPTCGGGCPVAQVCNSELTSPTCGQCSCDTSCGTSYCSGFTGSGEIGCENMGCYWTGSSCVGCDPALTCDDGSGCNGLGLSECIGDCSWDAAAGRCFSPTCGFCSPPTCGNCPPGYVCNPATGLCVCDTTCGGGCPDGRDCDNDDSGPSPTCGQCLCDIGCDGGCQTGQLCDDGDACAGLDTSSGGACETTAGCLVDPVTGNCSTITCGLCIVDSNCGGPCNPICNGADAGACNAQAGCWWPVWANDGAGGCYSLECRTCDANTGLCVGDPTCCDALGQNAIYDPSTLGCSCDDTCGGVCPAGTICDGEADSPNCGQCVCETDCGLARTGTPCPIGSICDSSDSSMTCGLCVADPTCGVGGNCNLDCADETDPAVCDGRVGECRWAEWLSGGAGGCTPLACEVCNPSSGLCMPDPDCCDACSPTEVCNPLNGECECDTHCGFACAPGLTCDADTNSPTCGLCLCDTSCGGDCPAGQACDDNSDCNPYADEPSCSSATSGSCTWDYVSESCLSVFCGWCVVTCDCPEGTICNPSTGLCEPQCPDCPPGTVCDPLTGECVCDQTCGGVCPLGSLCDSDLASPTCGDCVCDETCGGDCPPCQICDHDPGSGTCGMCVIDVSCGGPCGDGQLCDPLTGCCITDSDCECPPNFVCNPVTGQCEYDPGGG